MGVIFKWLGRLIGAALAAGLLAGAVLWVLILGGVPDYGRRWAVEGISERTVILRDTAAVPHIRGARDEDVYFGLGFAHAQDRLWQMETSRRAAQGRLSELFGEVTLPWDRFVRALDLDGLSRRAVAAQSPEAQAALEAYAAGVNAWIRQVADQGLGRGGPEFYLFTDRLAPWTPADSLSIAKLLALRLTDQAAVETRRARLSLLLPPERLRDVLPDHPDAAVIELTGTVPPAAAPFAPFAPAPFEPAPTSAPFGAPPSAPPAQAALQVMPRPGQGGASNAWAVAADRAAAGAPILAADPHLWLTAPSVWYLARLEFAEGGVIGGTVPGLPLILIGRNADFAWGLTSAYVDDADLHLERLHPDDPSRHLTPRGWAPFAERRTVIPLPGGRGVPEVLRATANGPVVPPDQLGVGAVTPAGHVMTLRWTGLAEGDASFSAGLALMRARGIDQAMAALRGHVVPAFNVMMADRAGIAMTLAGAVPLRHPNRPGRGRLPAPGWIPEAAWTGVAPWEALPRVRDPASGLLANANNRTSDGVFPHHVSFHWGDPWRIRRLSRQMSGREAHTRDSAVALQNDAVSEMARAILPLIARDLWWTGPAPPADPIAARRREALDLLADWTGEKSHHAPEPLIFAEWMRRLTVRLAEDELGPAVAELEGPQPIFVERVFRDVEGAGVWCDIRQTARVETCAEIAALALDDALAALAARYGGGPRTWRWGEAHEARHDHEVLGRLPFAGLVANIRHPVSGGDTTLLRTQSAGAGANPHAAVFGGGLRMVADFADPDNSVHVISTGQSGHPFSRHYDDLSQLWRRGDSLRMSLDWADAEGGALGLTVLVPLER